MSASLNLITEELLLLLPFLLSLVLIMFFPCACLMLGWSCLTVVSFDMQIGTRKAESGRRVKPRKDFSLRVQCSHQVVSVLH